MKTRPRVLFAEDDDALRGIVVDLLSDAGLEVEAAADGRAALKAFTRLHEAGTPPAALLADINMPHLDGLELIDRVHALDPQLPVVFVTAYSSVDSAVAALRKGAFDYLTKPFQNDHLVRTVQNAVRQRQLSAENVELRRAVRTAYGGDGVARSPGLAPVYRLVEKAAATTASVLIHGETGSGKEHVARSLHEGSPRAAGPFLTINCAALPAGLLESELFGHVKGAFTGATSASPGLFRAAHGGTLFLDEVGETPPAMQAKLLRVLEAREVRPVGGTQSVPVDVRVVAATHRDLLQQAEAGEFREDLFYRLAVIEVEVPPLRERPDDVAGLARHFLVRFANERGEPQRALSPELLQHLRRYRWPGNVRELINALEHAVTLGGQTLEVTDLPARMQAEPAAEELPAAELTLAELEQTHVQRVLRELGGNRREAAKRLGIDLSTLYRKLKRWDEA